MARQYSLNSFFRHVQKSTLKRYFDARGVLLDRDFSGLVETDTKPIFDAWQTIPESKRKELEEEFEDIFTLGCPMGIQAIRDEAEFRDENLSEFWGEEKEPLEQACLLFLQRPDYWDVARKYYRADLIVRNDWTEYRTISPVPARRTKTDCTNLEKSLKHHFLGTEYRGDHCVVEHYQRGERDYFFAFLMDYPKASVGYESSQLKRSVRHPAFEIIFAYSQAERKISLYMKGGAIQKDHVIALFNNDILGLLKSEYTKEKLVYNLEPLKLKDDFHYSPESGIQSVAIRQFKFRLSRSKALVSLEVNPDRNPKAIYELRDNLFKDFQPSEVSIIRVGFVAYIKDTKTDKITKKKFGLGFPNYCSLKPSGEDKAIRQLLIDSGIEPR